MHLVIDIGNTFAKALVFDAQGHIGEPMTGPSESGFLLRLLERSDVQSIAVASVIKLDDAVLSVIRNKKVLLVDRHTPMPIVSNYSSPRTLGIDRICAAIGARTHFPSNPVLTMDMGTCITYDLVNAAGEYLGGGISPGLRMRFRALSEFTSKLPQLEPEPHATLIGTDTASSIRSGVQHGIRLEVDGIVGSYSEQFPDLMTVGTGGDFPFFASAFKRPIFADPILVLRGLHEILLHNS
ncbi:MAG: type III pantothenate kinase [Flavobacteriales bacterium]|nr:type III pantothenate kinase [Flavobacteriales bacterium]